MDLERLDRVLAAAYDAALDHRRMPVLLDCLAELFDAHFADSFHRTVNYSQFGGIAVGLDPEDYQREFLDGWVKRNVWSRRRPVVRAGDVLTTRDILPIDELRRTEMFNDFLAPRGLHEGLRLDLFAADGRIEDISILRSASVGPFGADEVRIGRMLIPHLQRAGAIGRRLAIADGQAKAGLAAIDALACAVLLLDARMRLVHANPVALAMLAEADGLQVTPQGLAAANASLTRQLAALIADTIGDRSRGGRSGAIRLPRPSGRPGLTLTAIPVGRDNALAEAAAGPSTIVCVADPCAGAHLRAAELSVLFGLTRAEAALALELLAGAELREIAERSGRSVNTVRSLLARLMHKTDTRRQVELIRLLASLPTIGQEDAPAKRGG